MAKVTDAATRHNDIDLLNAIDQKVNELKKDKTMSKILRKYAVDDSLIVPPAFDFKSFLSAKALKNKPYNGNAIHEVVSSFILGC